MENAKQREILKELMRQIDEKVNVDAGIMYRNPTSSYTCTDLAAREWREFFQDHPQMIGLTGDLPEPDSFITLDDFGVPILATRDNTGRFRAFLNACRHRGSQIVTEARGTQRVFGCPFHKWTYNNSGELTGIPQESHFGDIDKSCMGLIELPAVESHGLLWVHPKPEGKLDVDSLLGDLAPEIASWDFSKLIYCGETVIKKRLNWKLANDTFGETYHFQKLHRNTLGQLFYGDNLAYETFGRNHRFVFASRAIDNLRELPEEEWKLTHGATLLYYLFPNIQFIVGRGLINVVRIYPDGTNPSTSISRVGHYFTPETLAAAQEAESAGEATKREDTYNFEARVDSVPSLESVFEVFASTISDEDYLVGETAQRSAENGLLKEVIFGRNEPALHHYHNTYRAAMGLPGLEEFTA